MAKSLANLRKEGVPHRLMQGIEAGETKTINEWAEEFNVFPLRIQSAMSKLRKLGLHVHPVGTVYGFGGEAKKGVVVDIMKNESHFTEVFDRNNKMRLDPAMKDFFHKVEGAKEHFPKLRYTLASKFNKFFSGFKLMHSVFGLPEPKVEKIEDVKEALRVIDER